MPRHTVPFAALVADHSATVLPRAQGPALQAAEQTLVRWTARLEREAAAWTHRLLELERVLDRPSFHDDTGISPARPEAPDDPTAGVLEADLEAVYDEVRTRAAAVHEVLEAGDTLQLDDAEAAFRTATDTTIDRLRAAADRAGTVLEALSLGPERTRRTAEDRRRARLDRWPDWFDEVTQRLSFLETLTALREKLVAQHQSLVAEVVEGGLAPARTAAHTTADALAALRDELDALLSPPEPGDAAALRAAFDEQAERAETHLEEALLGPLRDHGPRRATQAVVDAHREAVASTVAAQPDGFVVHPLEDLEADPVEPADAQTLQWRSGCREVLDELLFDAWRTAVRPLVERAEAVAERATEVRGVVQFNLGAAAQELQDLQAAGDADPAAASYVENARELALGGLDRAVDLLRAEDEDLDRATGEMLGSTWTATTTAWTDLHDRARAAGQTRAHVLRLRGELVRGTRWLAVEAGRRVRATTTQLRRVLHRVQRQGRRLVQLGHAAVGTTPVDEAALRQTVDTLSSIDTVLADLPLVYRRLFSFRPLQDEDLLVAREADRAAVERHAERWRQGLTSPLAITGAAGTGRTSLLNALRTTTFRSARYHSLTLTERVQSEAAFATMLARALSLPHDPQAEPTLEAVVERIKALPEPDRLRVCTIEQFEHVFQRTVGGTALGARIIGALSETDTRVLWIVTTTNAAWQFIEASEPAATRLVDRHTLEPLDRAELEELIMTRHRRSGLRLTFELPDESAYPILARRLRSIDDEERRQALLRAEFFDQLHDVCGQNVMLALFYWFRSVRLDEDGATLRVRPLEPVSFEVLDTLPLPHAFALKALLEHSTLTVGELADVLGVDPSTSRALLEALGNALVIAPAERVEGPGVFQFASVERGTRYRVRPLLVHPVIRFLRSRNIYH
jgi:DNA-binding transcriptional ArsR family regulator